MKRLFASVASVAALAIVPAATAGLAFAQNIKSSQAAAARVAAANVAANKVGQDRLFVASIKNSGSTAPQPSAAERALREKLAHQFVVSTGGQREVTMNQAVDDVITVTSESPLLDQENGSYVVPLTLHSDTLARLRVDLDIAGATVNAAELEKIPRTRDPFWEIPQHTPGVNDHGTVNGPDQPVIIPGVNPPRAAGGGEVIVLGNISQRKPVSTPAINMRGGTGAGFSLPPEPRVDWGGPVADSPGLPSTPIMTIPPRSPRPGWGTSAAATQPSNAVAQGSRILFLHDERSGPKSGGMRRAVLAHRSAAEE